MNLMKDYRGPTGYGPWLMAEEDKDEGCFLNKKRADAKLVEKEPTREGLCMEPNIEKSQLVVAKHSELKEGEKLGGENTLEKKSHVIIEGSCSETKEDGSTRRFVGGLNIKLSPVKGCQRHSSFFSNGH
uniref:Uncharacterized protein n=1 Tax=Nelumbo nucifera TaxID=4432 RepID=A0A822YHK8_NELNU|nr:TPA_asm: hypothetical protein HUJ06_012525 [Nelumbo nucifera]